MNGGNEVINNDEYMVGYWILDRLEETFVWLIDSIIKWNFGFILSTLWVVMLFLMKSTRIYSFGAVVLWLLFQI